MAKKAGTYHDVYIKKDGEYISLAKDTVDFCKTWIKPVHPKNWDWTNRDFNDPKNDPTVAEARAVRDLIVKDIAKGKTMQINLSGLENGDAIYAFLDPGSPHEEFNMEEFAFALKVELEHGKIRDANVTNNHPFLTAMIVLAHMSETVTYYKRLKVMETEGEIFEMNRKMASLKTKTGKKKIEKDIKKAQEELNEAKTELEKRLETMKDIPVLSKIGD